MTLTDNITFDSPDYSSEEFVSWEKGKLENLFFSILNVSRENLIQEQLADVTLKPLFQWFVLKEILRLSYLPAIFLKRGCCLDGGSVK